MAQRVSVIVINWRLKEETVECLRSVEQSSVQCRMIVVDNGSGDGSVEYIVQHCPQAEVIALPSNCGFAVACNQAIWLALRDATCEFIMLLNNDATIHPQAISELLRTAQANPEAGILGPKVYYRDRPDVIWYAGARRRMLLASDTGRGHIDRGQFNQVRQVDYVFGCALLIRRHVFEQIGVFDEQFFLYLEDLDFSLRVQRAGFALLFVPHAHVWHAGSASTADNHEWRMFHLMRSSVLFLKKYGGVWFLPLLVVWFLATLKFTLTSFKGRKLQIVRSYWQGCVAGIAPGPATTRDDVLYSSKRGA